MSRLLIGFIKCLLLLCISSECISQTDQFDIATYTPPSNWKKTPGNGVVAYSNYTTNGGTFCLVALYASSASAGDAQKDFQVEWAERVVKIYGTVAAPKTETQTSGDGWTVVSAAASIKIDNADAYAILTVFTGFKKKFTVLTTLNDQSYIDVVDVFLRDIKLDKTAMSSTATTTLPAATASNGTKQQFGSLVYTIPSGWNVTKYPDGHILIPADLASGESLQLWVQPAFSFSGTMDQALQKSYDETVSKIGASKMNDVYGGNYTKVEAKRSFKGWEYIRCSGAIHLGAGQYPPEFGLDLFVVKINGRYEKISILKSRKTCNMLSYYSSNLNKYSNAIEDFLFSLEFPDWKDAAVTKGEAKGGGIAGTWQGLVMSVGLQKLGTELGAELKIKQLIFFSNGQVYIGNYFPAEGLDEINTWIKAENARRDWGTYSFSNGRGILKMPYEDIPMQLQGGKLTITTNKTDHVFIKSNAVDGATFNGVYAFSSKDYAGNETGKTPLISFTEDGKFNDNGALKILAHEYVSCLNPANAPGSGVYEVKNYSVIFRYSDGRKIKIAFPGTGYDKSNHSPATLSLSFNEDQLKRR